jgi:hypothetical protein
MRVMDCVQEVNKGSIVIVIRDATGEHRENDFEISSKSQHSGVQRRVFQASM